MSADHASAFNLEHLKKQAKHLLRDCRAGEDDAISWMQARLPRLRSLDRSAVSTRIRLADLQHALAVDRGFPSWGALTRFGDPLARLLTAIRGAHTATLRRELPTFSGLAAANIFAACALGDARALRQHLALDASLAQIRRDGWTPLDYVCSSPVARLGTRHAASLCDCAELLLAAGSDPNTSVEDALLPDTALPAIMRAMLAGNLRLVTVLKNGGAQDPKEAMQGWMSAHADKDPLRLQQLFATFFQRPDTRERMRKAYESFKAKGEADGPILLDPRELPYESTPDVLDGYSDLWPALLDRGYNPASVGVTGRSLLHSLVTYAPVSTIDMFIQRGVDLEARDAGGRSVLATAVRAGNFAVAELLRSRGIRDDATLLDRLIGSCLAGDAAAAKELVARHAGIVRHLARVDADEFVRAAARGSTDQVRLMLTCGFPADAVGESGATALQQAAWHGQVPVVELLLAHGTSPAVRDDVYGETALDWASHGASHAGDKRLRCLEAARLIQRAGGR